MPLTTDYNCQFACVVAGDYADIIGCAKLSNLLPEPFLWQVDCLKGKIKALQAELDMAKSNTITAEALSDELNAEVIQHAETGVRPVSEDKGRTVLVPEKMFREMLGIVKLEAVRSGILVPVKVMTCGEEGTCTIISADAANCPVVEEKK